MACLLALKPLGPFSQVINSLATALPFVISCPLRALKLTKLLKISGKLEIFNAPIVNGSNISSIFAAAGLLISACTFLISAAGNLTVCSCVKFVDGPNTTRPGTDLMPTASGVVGVGSAVAEAALSADS